MVRKLVLFLAVLAAPSLARAAGKPLPGEQHDPPLFLDETGTRVVLGSQTKGYDFAVHLRIGGATSKSDRVRIEWKQGGKIVATAKCDLGFEPDEKLAYGDCSYDKTRLTAKGAIDAELIYTDDHADKDYLVRTFHVTVKTWPQPGKDVLWQILPDDLLAGAWARTALRDDMLHPEFLFWVAKEKTVIDVALRCTVDGAKLADLDGSFDLEEHAEDVDADSTSPKGVKARYHFAHVKLQLKNVFADNKEEAAKHGYQGLFLSEHLGKWVCAVRKDGAVLRELRFTVGAKGVIQQDEMNTGKGAIRTMPNVALIDLRIPKDSKWDDRVRPDAMKKSFGFGIAWPDHPKVKEILAALPPASGTLPDP